MPRATQVGINLDVFDAVFRKKRKRPPWNPPAPPQLSVEPAAAPAEPKLPARSLRQPQHKRRRRPRLAYSE